MSQSWFSVLGTMKQSQAGKAACSSGTDIPAGSWASRKRQDSELEGSECQGHGVSNGEGLGAEWGRFPMKQAALRRGSRSQMGLRKVFSLWVSDVTTVKEKMEPNGRFLNLTKEVYFVLFSFFMYRISGSPVELSYQTMRDPRPRNLHCKKKKSPGMQPSLRSPGLNGQVYAH